MACNYKYFDGLVECECFSLYLKQKLTNNRKYKQYFGSFYSKLNISLCLEKFIPISDKMANKNGFENRDHPFHHITSVQAQGVNETARDWVRKVVLLFFFFIGNSL